jgi:hypothetical protein
MAAKKNLSGNLLHRALINAIENNDTKILKKLLSFRNFFVFRNKSYEVLNNVLGHALEKHNYTAARLLIDCGADVNSKNENGKTPLEQVVHNYGITEELNIKNLKPYKQPHLNKKTHCFMLSELVLHDAKPQNKKEEDKLSTILDKNDFKDVAKLLKSRASRFIEQVNGNPPKKPPRTFKYKSSEHNTEEPIYAEIGDFVAHNPLESSGYSSISEESPYAEIGDSSDHNSLGDRGYLSVSQESLYAKIDGLEEQKKPIETKQESKQTTEPIYSKVDLNAKWKARKAKVIKENSRTYHGLVQDKASQWQEKINSEKQDPHENRRDSGYSSSCEVDSSIKNPKEQKKPLELNIMQGKFIKVDAGTYLKTGSVIEKVNKWQDICKQSNQEKPQCRSL